MGAGRPKKTLDCLPDGWQELVIEMAKEGASDVEIRAELDISDDLWYRFIEEEPEFSLTIKRAKRYCQAWWEKHGRKLATGESNGNPASWMFNMKNRFKWRDRPEEEPVKFDIPPIVINTK